MNNSKVSIQKKKMTVREKIIYATLYLIEKSREFTFTIRDIIEQAKVNIASVNYYFGSNAKQKLLKELHKRLVKTVLSINSSIIERKLTPEENIFAWFDEIIDYLTQNPGMIQIMRKNFDIDNEIGKNFNKMYIDFIYPYLSKIFLDLNQKEQNIISLQLFSAIFFPLLFTKEMLIDTFDFNIYEESDRQSYIHLILKSFKIE